MLFLLLLVALNLKEQYKSLRMYTREFYCDLLLVGICVVTKYRICFQESSMTALRICKWEFQSPTKKHNSIQIWHEATREDI